MKLNYLFKYLCFQIFYYSICIESTNDTTLNLELNSVYIKYEVYIQCILITCDSF